MENKTGTMDTAIRSGVISGAASVLIFTIVHQLFISNIWFSFPIMLFAGALCGLCLAWSYTLVSEKYTAKSWLGYTGWYVVIMVLLGIVSVVVFEPTVPMAVIVAANEPPGELIGQAFPMTFGITFACAVGISLLYKRSWQNFAAVLVTAIVLVLLLGLNVSTIGLVSIPAGSLYLIAEMYGLIFGLYLIFGLGFIGLERGRLGVNR